MLPKIKELTGLFLPVLSFLRCFGMALFYQSFQGIQRNLILVCFYVI